jgi:hypothetical protein
MNRDKTMENVTLKMISPERVKTLLASYGAEPRAWPADERSAALTLLNHSEELQTLWREARQLDEHLLSEREQQEIDADNSDAMSALAYRIVAQLPQQDSAAIAARAQGHGRKHWPLAAAAAVLLLAATFALQQQLPQTSSQQPEVAATEYEQWLWQDITGEAVTSEDNATETGELTFLALVELE